MRKKLWNSLIMGTTVAIISAIIVLSINQYCDLNAVHKESFWHYYVQPHTFQAFPTYTRVQISHQLHSQPIELFLDVDTYFKGKRTIALGSFTNITYDISLHSSQIKSVIVRSEPPLDVDYGLIRLLVQLNQDDQVIFMVMLLKWVLSTGRNLVIVGLLTNSLGFLALHITLLESITLLAFWNIDKHLLGTMYQQIFQFKFDLMNLIRLSLTDQAAPSNVDILSKLQFSDSILVNLSGELLVMLLLGLITLVFKGLAVFVKWEIFRRLTLKMRPLWNGYLYVIQPRLAVISGFHLRTIADDIVNGVIACFIMLFLVIYFVQLLLQIRQITHNQCRYTLTRFGLDQRLNLTDKFSFDQLHFSNLYYPAIQYILMLLYALPIGLSYDVGQLACGGVIASLLLLVLINIGSPGFLRLRDQIVYPFSCFILIITAISLIAVGLAQKLQQTQASIIGEKIFLFTVFVILATYIISFFLDILQKNGCHLYLNNQHKRKNSRKEQENGSEKKEIEIKEGNGRISLKIKKVKEPKVF